MTTTRNKQQAEIDTIKERTFKLRLSDADCERLAKKAGLHNLTASQLLENFIGDLVDGTFSNGSDERLFANNWFERCWFGLFPENTLLHHLLDYEHDVSEFLDAYLEKVYSEEHPEMFEDDRSQLQEGEKLWFEAELDDYLEFWEPKKEPNMTEEIERCIKWKKDFENFKK